MSHLILKPINKTFLGLIVYILTVLIASPLLATEVSEKESEELERIYDSIPVNPQKALAMLYELREKGEEIAAEDELEIAVAAAYAYYQLEDLGGAKKTLDDYMKNHGEDASEEDLARIYNFYGTIYFSLGSITESIKWYELSHELIRDKPLSATHASIMNNIGVLLLRVNQLEEARMYYREAYRLALELEETDPRGKSRVINAMINLGKLFSVLKQSDSAQYYLNQSLIEAEKLQDSTYILRALLHLGEHSANNQKMGLAKAYYQNILDSKTNRKNVLLEAMNKLGLIALENKEYDRAKGLFVSTINLSQEKKLSSMLVNANYYMYLLHKEQGQYEESLLYLEKYQELKDRRLNQEIANQVLALKFRMSDPAPAIIKSKQRQIHILLIALIIIGLVIIIISFFVKKQRLKLKNQDLQLNLKKEIEKQLKMDIESKNRELTAKAMQMNDSDRLKSEIKNQLLVAEKQDSKAMRSTIKGIISSLQATSFDSFWQQFEIYFMETNPKFYERLGSTFPSLSQNDLRLCAFLKLNMTIKEISNITNQSQNAVRVARTRLRKKLNINNEKISLYDYLNQF